MPRRGWTSGCDRCLASSCQRPVSQVRALVTDVSDSPAAVDSWASANCSRWIHMLRITSLNESYQILMLLSGFANAVTRAPMSAGVSSGTEARQRHSLVKDPMCLDRPTTHGGIPESTQQALARDLEGRSSDFRKIFASTSEWTTLSLESCAAPPEAVSTASPSSPQLLEQEERPSNRRARETYVHIARDEVRDLTAGAASSFKWPHSTIKRANAAAAVSQLLTPL